MKKLDLIKLTNEKPYIKNNLQKNMHGVVISEIANEVSVLFFNPQNIGNYAVVNVSLADIVLEQEELPDKMQKEILSNLDKIISKAKNFLEPIVINNYDMVELLVEDGQYAQF